MKTISLFLSISLLTLVSSCQQSSEKIEITESKDSNSKELPQGKSIISFDNLNNETPDELAFREWELPQRLQESWATAKEIKYSDTLRFDQIKNILLIDYTVLSKDPSNFILKKIKITAPEASTQYNFAGEIDQQFNLGTKTAYNMAVVVTIQARLKPEIEGENRLFGNAYSITGKDGVIKPF